MYENEAYTECMYYDVCVHKQAERRKATVPYRCVMLVFPCFHFMCVLESFIVNLSTAVNYLLSGVSVSFPPPLSLSVFDITFFKQTCTHTTIRHTRLPFYPEFS